MGSTEELSVSTEKTLLKWCEKLTVAAMINPKGQEVEKFYLELTVSNRISSTN